MKSFAIALFLSVACLNGACAQQEHIREVRSEHFLVYYPEGVDESYARGIADTAEGYYRDITQEFNLIRDKLWLWENRAKIFIAKDEQDYRTKYKCPAWSGACVNHEDKMIYTYPDQKRRSTVFSHELTHIIFREYVGSGRFPLWLDEAAATYIENKYGGNSYENRLFILKNAMSANGYIKFSDLNQMSTSSLATASRETVDLFYIESFSIVSFMVKRYGRDNFSQFLYFLKNGSTLEEAIPKTFQSVRTIDDLEAQWKKFYTE
ncbi:MAG: peptidase MA family metallohydrolase [Candidatus Omnitrophica bacterium]|nr:peptidase MA family metallohydrolase [Candidatus Omnitrophota bacterium]